MITLPSSCGSSFIVHSFLQSLEMKMHVIPTKVFFPLPWLNTSATTARAPTQTSKPQMLLRNKKAQDRSEEEVQMLGLPWFFISRSKKATDKKEWCIHRALVDDFTPTITLGRTVLGVMLTQEASTKESDHVWRNEKHPPELERAHHRILHFVLCQFCVAQIILLCSSSSSCCYPILKTKFQGVLVVQQKKTRIGTMRNNVVRASWVPLKIRPSLRTTESCRMKKGSIKPVNRILTMTIHISRKPWGCRV